MLKWRLEVRARNLEKLPSGHIRMRWVKCYKILQEGRYNPNLEKLHRFDRRLGAFQLGSHTRDILQNLLD